MTETDLAGQLDVLQRQLEVLWDANREPNTDERDQLTLEELSTAVEELQAATDELRRAGEAVATEKRRYAELFEFAPDVYTVTDVDCVIQEANQAAYRLLGNGRTTLLGKPLTAYLEDPVGLHRRVAALRAGDSGPLAWEARVRGRDGKLLSVGVRVSASHDAWGRTAGFRWILHELTERALMEERERAASALVNTRLRDHNRRLAELEKAKSEFLRLGSHELRSPLSIIQGYVSMSLAGDFGPVSGDLARALTIAYEHCRLMSGLIDHMLDTALVGDGDIELQRTVIDLREVVRGAVDGEADASQPMQRVRLALGASAVPVDADLAQLRKAVTALVDNALKYSPPEADVLCELGMDLEHGRAFLAINDLGRGIDDAARAQLFKRFGRVVTSDTSNIRGGGLGLFLAREIARLHGGDVTLAETAPGAGSTFVLDLPLAEPRD